MPLIRANRLLEEVFGYPSFRPLQQEIITAVLKGRDTLAVLPTGGGKSLCYQLPALIFEGLTVVVSPLISLMQDQVDQLVRRNIPAAVLNSSLDRESYFSVIDRLKSNELKLLYLAPETLLKQRTLQLLRSLRVDCLTIDEAHCISEWGHDFRGEYRQIASVREMFPRAACLALTATATPRVRKDIIRNLKMREPQQFVAGFDRPNFFLEVIRKEKPKQQTLDFIRDRLEQSGIVYCFSRKQVDELTMFLQDNGITALPYHAGLPDGVRMQNQQRFIDGSIPVIVATIAFGMGIDKPDIRFVLHYDLPQDVESYYQQIGRAGRDGGAAHCRLLFGFGDLRKIRYFIEQKSAREQKRSEERLKGMVDYAQSLSCRRQPLLKYFGEKYHKAACGSCDRCLGESENIIDVTLEAHQFFTCMKATREIFGVGHLIDVLLGRSTEKTKRHGHEKLTVWGIGKHREKGQWHELVRHLLHQELLYREEQYGSLKLTPEGRNVCDNQLAVEAHLQPVKPVVRKKTAVSGSADPALQNALKQLRKTLADADGVPAYYIFSNKVLDALATVKPVSEEMLLGVPGIGPKKVGEYGGAILALMRQHR